ncbi:MAG: prefoldin subunit alpha [Candidatus Nanopusillus acidilobi]|jgi:prefoldin alpha subunit
MENSDEILDFLYSQLEAIQNKILEYELIKTFINELKKQEDTYINLGGLIFVRGSIKDDQNLLINIGRNIFTEKSKDEVLKLIDDIINKLNQDLNEIKAKINEISMKRTPQP